MVVPILFETKNECCGCTACANSCPNNAITITIDEVGVTYPSIDSDKCVGCGLCCAVCNYIKQNNRKETVTVFAAVSKEYSVCMNSSSGGIFYSIAKSFIRNGGVVYGAAYERMNSLSVKHIRVGKLDELRKLQGTKYVQSQLGFVFKNVKQDLKEGIPVLFSGTPCQIDGLYGYLKNEVYNNLYTIDILCHGTPGIAFFQSYISYLEKKHHGKLIDINFRDKKYGWCAKGSYTIKSNNRNVTRMLTPHNSVYYRLFLDSASYRENCYSCKYANDKRVGDISIGDFWGIEQVHPEYLVDWNKSKGISCVLVNSDQGKRLIDEYGDLIEFKLSSLENVSKANGILVHPCKNNENRIYVRRLYNDGGFKAIEKWYWKKQGIRRYLFVLADLIRNVIK